MQQMAMQLEQAASLVHEMSPRQGSGSGSRHDRAFASLLTMLGPRIRHLTRVYGLTDLAEDAAQACAIGVHRALQSYDPARARFTTHVTWQMRGELQGLRHRMRLDQRQSARSASVRTVSLDDLCGPAGDRTALFEIVDEQALEAVEAAASDTLAERAICGLMDRLGSPEHERQIVRDALADREPAHAAARFTSEQRRQIVRRTFRNCAKLVSERSLAA